MLRTRPSTTGITKSECMCGALDRFLFLALALPIESRKESLSLLPLPMAPALALTKLVCLFFGVLSSQLSHPCRTNGQAKVTFSGSSSFVPFVHMTGQSETRLGYFRADRNCADLTSCILHDLADKSTSLRLWLCCPCEHTLLWINSD